MLPFALVVLAIAAASTALFFWNLHYYRPPQSSPQSDRFRVSILIPARDEERCIEDAVRAVLATTGVAVEVIVADDQSRDATAEIVARIAKEDHRVRLIAVPPLPHGWCGKQFACQCLSGAARYETLCFLDADVKLARDGLMSFAAAHRASRAALLSGFPKQETKTILERMLIPLMHFLLLGYLPMIGMRKTNKAAYGAGCGQIFLVDADAYRDAGGHAAIRNSRHDGLSLPRAFRHAGYSTDLRDLTRVASCRMYRSNREVVFGLLKNATEGLASAARILPFSLLLFLGQVCPLLVFAWCLLHGATLPATLAAVAVLLSYLPRLISVRLFRQSIAGALLHPFAIAILLAIQWTAFGLAMAGVPSVWKGRRYSTT